MRRQEIGLLKPKHRSLVAMRVSESSSLSETIRLTPQSSLVIVLVSSGWQTRVSTVNLAAKVSSKVSLHLLLLRPFSDLVLDCPDAKLSGFTVDGTFQEYVVSYVHHVTPIPEGFDSAAAASVLCAVR